MRCKMFLCLIMMFFGLFVELDVYMMYVKLDGVDGRLRLLVVLFFLKLLFSVIIGICNWCVCFV